MPARALRSCERPPMRTQRSDIPDLDVANVHGGNGENSTGDYTSLRYGDAFCIVVGSTLSNSTGAYGGEQAPQSRVVGGFPNSSDGPATICRSGPDHAPEVVARGFDRTESRAGVGPAQHEVADFGIAARPEPSAH